MADESDIPAETTDYRHMVAMRLPLAVSYLLLVAAFAVTTFAASAPIEIAVGASTERDSLKAQRSWSERVLGTPFRERAKGRSWAQAGEALSAARWTHGRVIDSRPACPSFPRKGRPCWPAVVRIRWSDISRLGHDGWLQRVLWLSRGAFEVAETRCRQTPSPKARKVISIARP
jgi:hypothetical protein